MSARKFQGSCECEIVRFEATLDLSLGTFKCNCRMCAKGGFWGTIVKPESFKLLTGESNLTGYGITGGIEHRFCKTCGIKICGRGELELLGGKFVGVNIRALDDLPPEQLANAPIQFFDGRNDNFTASPKFTTHL